MLHKKSVSLFVFVAAVLMLGAFSVAAQTKTQIRWYCCLGGGSDGDLPAKQQAVVDAFNASQSDIELTLEVVVNTQAYDTLSTEIAAGNAPDIVGPVGARGRASFPGAWLDLAPYVEKTGYDLSDFNPAVVDSYKSETEGQVGIPFAIYPSFLLYNKDLFDEAGLAYPPTAYGEPYVDADGVEHEWNMDTITELSKVLTVDTAGNDATADGFDNTQIVQWGFGVGYTDMRGRDTLFGAANFVDADGKAIIPDNWRAAENWYHEAQYGAQAFYPSGAYASSDLLAGGNWFGSGHVAMMPIHLWYMGWGTGDLKAAWDIAPIPSYNGVTTAKLHADTFSIMKSTKNPDAAFTVLSYMLGEKAGELAALYGGLPARLSLQDSYMENYIASLSTSFPNTNFDVNWDVALAGANYPDVPNHEAGMPAFLETTAAYAAYQQIVDNNADADVNAELDKLQVDMQAVFDAAK